MCGIAGLLLFDADPCLLERITSMTSAMKHRGPDDEGYAFFSRKKALVNIYGGADTPPNVFGSKFTYTPKETFKGHVPKNAILAFGHRRLSILDLSPAGHQPMCTEDGRYWIIYNGEIYNFSDISKILIKKGEKIISQTDTEIILKAYRHWGPNCLSLFNGMWAFAIWDNVDQCLFCARDRIGIKPFYYTIQDKYFIFASDIKTIIASNLYSPEPDIRGLYLSMAFGIAPRPKTAFKDIFALEQAHWMKVFPDRHIKKSRYWSIPVGTQDHSMQEKCAVELLEEQLTKAIRRRLVADVTIGTFMSGGIDSTTISAIASTIHPGIKAFTLAYENSSPELDEVPQARATAAIHPIHHIVHTIKPEDTLKDLDAWVDGYEEPFHHLAANYVISKIVKNNGVTVVLNGLGGDELFAGYGYYNWPKKWRWIRKIRPILPLQIIGHAYKAKNLRLVSKITSPDRLHTALFTKFADQDLQDLFTITSIEKFNTVEFIHQLYVPKGIKFEDDIEAFSYMDLVNYIGNHHVHRADQFTMAHSIESRFPFLDHEFVELAFKIPSHLKVNGSVQKYILRKLAKKFIAPECLSMEKKGFTLPLEQWVNGPLAELISEKIVRLKNRCEFSSHAINIFLHDYKNGKRPVSQLWHLVSLELWYERFMERSFN